MEKKNKPNSYNAIKNYEKNLAKLENIVNSLESGDLSLENALKQYEEGISLIKSCREAINSAQNRIEILNNETQELEEFDDLAGDQLFSEDIDDEDN